LDGYRIILYGPLLNGVTKAFRLIQISVVLATIEKHKVTQFYTAPTAIRALAKKASNITLLPIDIFESDWISGRTINEEAWHWYNNHVGDKKCPVVDTWWQTETGGIMISPIAL
jgi:acetyl-CoA synthetase